MAMYFTEFSDEELRQAKQDEDAKRMAKIIFHETERLKTERDSEEKRTREAHERHCAAWRQFQPKIDCSNIDREELLAATRRELGINPDKYLCEIDHPQMGRWESERIESISASSKRACFSGCN